MFAVSILLNHGKIYLLVVSHATKYTYFKVIDKSNVNDFVSNNEKIIESHYKTFKKCVDNKPNHYFDIFESTEELTLSFNFPQKPFSVDKHIYSKKYVLDKFITF